MAIDNDFSKQKSVAELVCAQALEGTLRLDEFYERWSPKPEPGTFWHIVYDDVEDGVQHSPGTWFGGKVDLAKWRKCPEYFVIYVDLLLVRSGGDPARFLEVRESALAKKLSLVAAEEFVATHLGMRRSAPSSRAP